MNRDIRTREQSNLNDLETYRGASVWKPQKVQIFPENLGVEPSHTAKKVIFWYNKSMKEKIKKYLPDILILIGIWIFFYVYYFPVSGGGLDVDIEFGYNYSNNFKFVGIILITIGIDIAIRKYLSFRNDRKN